MSGGNFNDAQSAETEAVLHRFNQVFLSHKPDALAELVADDCVIENTQPAPDGVDSPIKGTDFAVLKGGRIRAITGFLDQVPQGA